MRRVVRWCGFLLIVSGLGLMGYVGWQMWGTNWVSQQRHAEVLTQIQQEWSAGRDTAPVDEGPAGAIVHIPRFGADFAVPLLEGTSDEALAAGLAHFPESAEPGGIGNFAIAGHRVTHGEPLRQMPELIPGDEIVVETRDHLFTYVLDTGGADLSVRFDESWVLSERPKNPKGGLGPGVQKRLFTLVTCAELFHTDERLVAFGHLSSATQKN